MKAIVIREFGGPEVLKYEEIPDLAPSPDEVLIAVHGVSVNFTLDITVRSGAYARGTTLPHVLGVDPVGEVVAVGGAVTTRKPGDRVAVHTGIRCRKCVNCLAGNEADCTSENIIGVHRWGGYADLVAVPERNAYRIPDNLGFHEAVVVMRHLPTARHLVMTKGELRAGEWVLVMGAAGGLGSNCVQVAKLAGAHVIAAAGADDRVAAALEFGADYGVNYRTQDLTEEVMKITDGRGVNLVAENIADPELWPGAFNSMGRNGRLVTAGAHGGGTVPLDVRKLYIQRYRIIGSPGCNDSDVAWAMQATGEGKIKPANIDRIMKLSEAEEAHRLMEARTTSSKILLDPTLDK